MLTRCWLRRPISGGIELSRNAMLMMMRADAEDRAKQRAREEAAAARHEEAVARAEADFRQFGEWQWETRARELDLAARREETAEVRRAQQRAERSQGQYAEMIAAGRRPGTIQEILADAALYP